MKMKNKGYKFGFNRGQSVVEFALVFPVFILIVIGISEFGLYFWTSHVVQNASREGARFAAITSNLEVNDSRVIDRVEMVLPDTGLVTAVTTTNTVTTCEGDDQVTVTVTGTYNFVFLQTIGINRLNLHLSDDDAI